MKDIFNIENILSITELQKLSLKRLRRMRPPLLVLDKKSKKKGFVILDMKGFEALKRSHDLPTAPTLSPQKASSLPDFRGQGLLWDRPTMTNRDFWHRLRDKNHEEHDWSARRLFEYAPSPFITQHFTLVEIDSMISSLKLRSPFQEAWTHALHYWTQKS